MRRLALRLATLAMAAGLAVASAWATPAAASGDAAPLRFETPAEARRFHALVAGLRCVMCQNQSLADSDALIAHELRAEVLALMREGMTDAQIEAHLVARYGEFVLYRPRVAPGTWLLWFGPGVLLLAGGFVVVRLVRAGRAARDDVPEDREQEW